MLSGIVGADHTYHNVFKGWAYVEEITKLCREYKVCWNSAKNEIWGITISTFPFILTYPLFVRPYIGSLTHLGNIRALWWKILFYTCVLQEPYQGFWGKRSVSFESKYHQFFNSFSSNDAYPSPKKYTEGKWALEEVYCVEVEEGTMNCCNDKRKSILSPKEHLHKNGKASPHYSEDGWLKPAPNGQAPVHGTYDWWKYKDVYAWAKLWILLPPVTELEDD